LGFGLRLGESQQLSANIPCIPGECSCADTYTHEQACLIAESIITQVGFEHGFGKHWYNIESTELGFISLGSTVAASVSCFASTVSKIAFGVTLLRLTFGWYRRFIWVIIITLFIVMIPSAFLSYFQCTPASAAWDPYVPGECWPRSTVIRYSIFNNAYSALMDIILALIPSTVVAKLQMSRREKIGVSVAMGMGVLSVQSYLSIRLSHLANRLDQCRNMCHIERVLPIRA
jgi:hypothetical protein